MGLNIRSIVKRYNYDQINSIIIHILNIYQKAIKKNIEDNSIKRNFMSIFDKISKNDDRVSANFEF